MKNNFLFAHKYKRIGWFILIPSTVLGILYMIFDFNPGILDIMVPVVDTGNVPFSKVSPGTIEFRNNNLFNEIIAVLVLFGALFVAFSKEETEDEFISEIRLKSLVWAVYFNSALLLFSILFLYDFAFFYFMQINMFAVLIFFIVRFNWKISKLKKSVNYAE